MLPIYNLQRNPCHTMIAQAYDLLSLLENIRWVVSAMPSVCVTRVRCPIVGIDRVGGLMWVGNIEIGNGQFCGSFHSVLLLCRTVSPRDDSLHKIYKAYRSLVGFSVDFAIVVGSQE